MARSKSPSDSSRAFLQFIMPAAVISRSRLTSAMFTEAIAFSLWDFVVDRVGAGIRAHPLLVRHRVPYRKLLLDLRLRFVRSEPGGP